MFCKIYAIHRLLYYILYSQRAATDGNGGPEVASWISLLSQTAGNGKFHHGTEGDWLSEAKVFHLREDAVGLWASIYFHPKGGRRL